MGTVLDGVTGEGAYGYDYGYYQYGPSITQPQAKQTEELAKPDREPAKKK